MAKILPFKPILPNLKYAGKVSTKSINTYSTNELKELHNNPYSFVKVVQPDYNETPKSIGNSHERFKKVRQAFIKQFKADILKKINQKSVIIYQQKTTNKTYTGIIAGASTEDYQSGVIKKHEETISARELIFTDYLKICGFNAEPVLLTYQNNHKVDVLINGILKESPYLSFFTEDDQITHSIWLVTNINLLAQIQAAFNEIDKVYIADGHHRCASSYRLSNLSNEKSILSFFVSDQDIEIHDFNRVVKDLNNLSKDEFIERLKKNFQISLVKDLAKPTKKHTINMYIDGEAYELKLIKSINKNNPIESLDSQILTDFILSPVLGISDLKTDERISFVSGKNGVESLKEKIDYQKFKVGFCLFPVTYQELTTIADKNYIMPPKSTWIEPKLRTGLTIYQFNDQS